MKTNYEASIQRQILRAIETKTPASYFDRLAEREEAIGASMAYGNKASHTREANRCKIVAAALRDAGL